jgi:hypothetical protein
MPLTREQMDDNLDDLSPAPRLPEPTAPGPVGERRYVGLCGKCRGVGKIPYGAASRTCDECKGSGNIYENVVPSPDNAADHSLNLRIRKVMRKVTSEFDDRDWWYRQDQCIDRILAALDRGGAGDCEQGGWDVSEWEPTDGDVDSAYHVWLNNWGTNKSEWRAMLKHIHANPSLAGLDAPKLPTRSEIRAIFERWNYSDPNGIASQFIQAGYGHEDEPEYTEEEVEELALAMWPGTTYYDYNQTGMDMARRVLAAGYRKAKP